MCNFFIHTTASSSLKSNTENERNDQLPVGRALHRYRKGHGFKSHTGLNFFFKPYFHNCLGSVHYCEDRYRINYLSLLQNCYRTELLTLSTY